MSLRSARIDVDGTITKLQAMEIAIYHRMDVGNRYSHVFLLFLNKSITWCRIGSGHELEIPVCFLFELVHFVVGDDGWGRWGSTAGCWWGRERSPGWAHGAWWARGHGTTMTCELRTDPGAIF